MGKEVADNHEIDEDLDGKGSHATIMKSREHGGKECITDSSPICFHENGDEGSPLPCIKNTNSRSSSLKEKIMNFEAQNTTGKKKLIPMKSTVRFPDMVNGQPNHTAPQPIALPTIECASVVSQPLVTSPAAVAIIAAPDADDGDDVPNVKNLPSPVAAKQHQTNAHLMSRRHPQLDNIKHLDEEDTHSVASSTASVRAKFKPTMGYAPVLRCVERAEKRKEFYTKLEEKHQALEAEKLEQEARIMKEREAALKQQRKNMAFKATPLPTFYHEGPPAKVEIKKPSPTRAKSPNLGRRKSCSDLFDPAQGDGKPQGGCSRSNRQSLGSHKERNTKSQCSVKEGTVVCKGPKSAKDSPSPLETCDENSLS